MTTSQQAEANQLLIGTNVRLWWAFSYATMTYMRMPTPILGEKTARGLVIVSGPHKGNKRGMPTKWGLICPHCNKEFLSETTYINKRGRCYDCRGVDLRIVDENTTYKYYFNFLKVNSYGKVREIGISLNDFKSIASMPCHYCGIEPEYRTGKYEWNPPVKIHGLDRVDSSGGYTLGNVVSCCKWCNIAKLDRSTEDFLEWARRLVKNNE